jgi:uncharacterized membrane protein SpoIIM required for sporulation
MNQDSFTARYQGQWQQFEAWLDSHDTSIPKSKRVPFDKSIDVPHLYRQLCHHLSLAQSRNYNAHLIDYLNQLTLRGHQYLYQSRVQTRSGFMNFVFYEFPRLVREQWKLFWLAALLFYGPLVGVAVGIQYSPELVYSVIPPEQVSEFRYMYDPKAEHIGRNRESGDDFLMFGFYIKNNISVGFQTFAGGMLFGLGSIFFLFYNGLVIGAVAGHLTEIGYAKTFYSFVIGHGSFELTAIVIAGMAGLNLGIGLIKPGQLTRLQSLKQSSRVSMKLVYGVILMLIVAAFLEAFWSSKGALPAEIKFTVGSILWSFIVVYFLFAGRRRAT